MMGKMGWGWGYMNAKESWGSIKCGGRKGREVGKGGWILDALMLFFVAKWTSWD